MGIIINSENWQVCARTHLGSDATLDFTDIEHWNWAPAKLPFDAISWLHQSGQGDDPFTAQNDLQYRWAEDVDWVLRKEFTLANGELDLDDELQLAIKDLDCYCDVYLNGTLLGRVANQFREHLFDLETLHTDKPNELVLYIRSAKHVNSKLEAAYGQLPAGFDSGRIHARRCQAFTGWDFTPRLSSVVLLTPPEIRAIPPVQIAHPHAFTATIPGVEFGQEQVESATINAFVELLTRRRGTGELTWEISDPQTGEIFATKTEQLTIKSKPQRLKTVLEIPNARLWWSAGVGDQPLYRLTVHLKAADRLNNHYESTQSCTFGIRTLTISRQKDDLGESFTPILNGHPVYCRGANWLPINLLLSQVTSNDYSQLIAAALGAGINCLRVWGGGIYERDEFYDLCDQAGILVWQDFMFACAAYPVYREFLDEVESEATYQVTRLRNHPSLMLWCGNNENEWLHQIGNLKKGNEQRIIGETIWSHVLNDVVEDHDPSRIYHQSSPFGRNRTNFNDMSTGDRHSWEVWADWAPTDNYLQDTGRFITEFGVQSLPHADTIAQITQGHSEPPLTDPALTYHQRMEEGMERLVRYTAAHYEVPKSTADWINQSQQMQALVVSRAVNHWRRRRTLTAGSLIWHFNEPYPAITWSMVDFYRRPKAVLNAASRFYAPVLLSLEINVSDNPVFTIAPENWNENQPQQTPSLPVSGEGFTCVMPEPIIQCRLHVINATALQLTGRITGGFFRGQEELETLASVQVISSPNGSQMLLTHVLDKSLMDAVRHLELRAEFHLDSESMARLQSLEARTACRQREIMGDAGEPLVPVSFKNGLQISEYLVEPKYRHQS